MANAHVEVNEDDDDDVVFVVSEGKRCDVFHGRSDVRALTMIFGYTSLTHISSHMDGRYVIRISGALRLRVFGTQTMETYIMFTL